MLIDEKVKARLDELLEMGDEILTTKHGPGAGVMGDARVDSQMAYQWATSVQNLLVRIFGRESEHYTNFTKQVDRQLTYSPAFCAQGILRAAKDDYENDYLFNVRQLIEAELFDNFLEQARHLYDSGYHQPAAVIAGCVLEDGLRKLCIANGLALSDKPKLDQMNAELAKAGIYSKLTQKKLIAVADLRNRAAHGQWDQFSKDDVDEMIRSVRKFMEEHFA